MLYDAHTHLNSNELYPAWEEHVLAFVEAGGRGLVVIGVDQERNTRALDIAHKRTSSDRGSGTGTFFLKTAIGYHPSEASLDRITSEQDIATHMHHLEEQLVAHRTLVVAIGECGTDLHYPTTPEQHYIQKELFTAQCLLARSYHLPVVVHSRDDFYGTWDVVRQFPDVRFYFHCRGYTPAEIELALSHPADIYIGFCGNFTYPKAQQLRDSLDALVTHTGQQIPKQLLLETDAPYLIPQQRRGQQNAPKYIGALYAYVAQHLHVSPSALEDTLHQNIAMCYQLPVSG